MVSRTGYTGELGYEIFCHPKKATEVWDAVMEAGKEFDITPMGLDALDLVRVEAGLIFANYEFDDQTDPFEAGIGFTVPLKSKEDDFIGKESLIERKAFLSIKDSLPIKSSSFDFRGTVKPIPASKGSVWSSNS